MRWADHLGVVPSELAARLSADDVEAILAYERRVGPVGMRRMDLQQAHLMQALGQWKETPSRDDLTLYRAPDERTPAQREADERRAAAMAIAMLAPMAREVTK